ncbi:MAG: DedA family protein [Candidatus Acetothermia bacterium]|nr:DedA family protein [Candidatus Acetothermia bacterium]MDH7505146.1 DedA family protein [Candidatus Acetothermia bacterium]
MDQIASLVVGIVERLGYPGILAGMFLESSFFPFPSEVIVPPAGYLASQGKLSLWLMILSGILGSLLGAIFNYWLALKLGRPLILRLGRYLGLTEKRYEKAEGYFRRHGEISTFLGRLIPGVRQYISLPAGLARMALGRFALFTALGAGIWVTVLAWLGYLVGNNKELLKQNLRQVTIYALIGSAVIALAYILWHRRRSISTAKGE